MTRLTLRLGLLFCVLVTARLVAPWLAAADSFDWRDIGGSSFVTGVRDQGSAGTCWAFAATAALEAKYLLTRNDPTYALDLSEQNLVCGTYVNDWGGLVDMGDVDGGYDFAAMNYFVNIGIVREGELPYTEENTSPLWPLRPGWESRVVKTTPNANPDRGWTLADGSESGMGWGYLQVPSNPAWVREALREYGPLVIGVYASDTGLLDDLGSEILGTKDPNHSVLLTGYDNHWLYGDPIWVIKNSWGDSWYDFNDGYNWLTYGNLERHDHDVFAIPGKAYYTGSMGTYAWAETSGGSWNTSQDSWVYSVELTGTRYDWPNGEYSALFRSPNDSGVPISVGSVSMHQMDIESGAVGYTFTGGRLLVTGGGIHTQEDCTIDSTVALGMDQTWTVAAGKTLTVNGNVKMHINSLTVGGEGQTTISGNLEDVSSDPQFDGLLTAYHPGLTKIGSGVLTLSGDNTYTGSTAVNGGVLQVASASAIPAGGEIDVNSGGTAAAAPALFPTLLAKTATTSEGTAALSGDSIADVDLSPFETLSLGAVGEVTFAHTLTPHGTTYRLGGGGGTLTFASPIAGSNRLVVCGGGSGGVVVLSGNNTYTGGTTVNGGVLQFDSAIAIPASGAIDVKSGGTATASPALFPALLAKIAATSAGTAALDADSIADVDMSRFPNLGLGAVGTVSLSHNVTPHGATYRLGGGGGTLIVSSALTGPNSLVVRDGGSDGVVVLTSDNTYTGSTTVQSGTLQCGDGTIGHDGSITSGTITNNAELVYNLFGTQTYNGAIGGTGSVAKEGPGTLILSGTNSYSGGTPIRSGTLQATTKAALAGYGTSGKIGVASGATLAVNAGGLDEWTADDIAELVTAQGSRFSASGFLGIDTTHAASGQFVYAKTPSGPLGLRKMGTGTLSLEGEDDNFNGDI